MALRCWRPCFASTRPGYSSRAWIPGTVAYFRTSVKDALAMFVMQAHADEYTQRKTAAIKLLMANKHCPFTEAELQVMKLSELEGIVLMARRRGRAEDEIPAPPSTFAK